MKDSQQVKKKQKTNKENLSPLELFKKLQGGYGIVLSISFFSILLLLFTTLQTLKNDIHKRALHGIPFEITIAPYPILKTVLGISQTSQDQENTFDISAQAAVILDDASHIILFSKNPSLSFSMASTTKIMTALVSMEHFSLDDELTIQRSSIEGAKVGFMKGEKIIYRDMLYAMLLPSGNDAAFAIADNFPGGVSAFVDAMNAKAKNLQLNNTHYADPAGLNDKGDYTTVTDLAYLASFARKNKLFSEVVSTKKWIVKSINKEKIYTIYNLNKLLGFDGINGIKTGYTDEAGEVLVTARSEGMHTLIFVVMKSKDRFEDTKKLLKIVSGKIEYQDFYKQ